MMVGDDDFAPASHLLYMCPKKKKEKWTLPKKLCRKEKNDAAFSYVWVFGKNKEI